MYIYIYICKSCSSVGHQGRDLALEPGELLEPMFCHFLFTAFVETVIFRCKIAQQVLRRFAETTNPRKRS